MIGRWLGWVAVAFAAASLVLVIVDFFLAQQNRGLQTQVNQRQDFINESVQLNRVNQALIQAMAAAVVNDKDDKLRSVLTENGITVNVRPNKAGASPAPVTPKSGGTK